MYRTCLNIYKQGTETIVQYRDEVLDPIVKLYAAAVDSSYVLADDNACPLRAIIFDDSLDVEGIVRIQR